MKFPNFLRNVKQSNGVLLLLKVVKKIFILLIYNKSFVLN